MTFCACVWHARNYVMKRITKNDLENNLPDNKSCFEAIGNAKISSGYFFHLYLFHSLWNLNQHARFPVSGNFL